MYKGGGVKKKVFENMKKKKKKKKKKFQALLDSPERYTGNIFLWWPRVAVSMMAKGCIVA